MPFAAVSDVCRDNSVTCMAPTKAFNLAGLQTGQVEGIYGILPAVIDKRALQDVPPVIPYGIEENIVYRGLS